MQRIGDNAQEPCVAVNERTLHLNCRGARSTGMDTEMNPGAIGASQGDSRYLRRYKILTNELSLIERENLAIFNELGTSKARVERLRFEHKLLLEKLKEIISSRRSQSYIKGSKSVQDLVHDGHHCSWIPSNSSLQHHPQNYPFHHREFQYGNLKKRSLNSESWNRWSDAGNFDSSSSTCSECPAQQGDAAERHSCYSNRDDQYMSTFPSKKSKRQKLKDRDPNAPKRPSNAFMYFCEMQREALKKQRENLDEHEQERAGLNNLTKALGLRWQALSDEERRWWKERFLAKVEKYYSDMKCYKGSNYPNAPQTAPQLPSKNHTFDSFGYIPCESSSKSDDDKLKSPQTSPGHDAKDTYKIYSTPQKSKQDVSRKSSSIFEEKIPSQEKPSPNNTDCNQGSLTTKNELSESSPYSSPSSQSELSDLDPNLLGDMESDSVDQDSRNSKGSHTNSPIAQKDN